MPGPREHPVPGTRHALRLVDARETRDTVAYRDLLVLFTKYGRKDFRLNFDPQDILAEESNDGEVEPDVKARAEAFARSPKEMGPTYVKFGQVLSTRPDIVASTAKRAW